MIIMEYRTNYVLKRILCQKERNTDILKVAAKETSSFHDKPVLCVGKKTEANDRPKPTKPPISCYRCGSEFLATVCPQKDVVCSSCKTVGNFAGVCMYRPKIRRGNKKKQVLV